MTQYLTPQHSLIYAANELSKAIDNLSSCQPTTEAIQDTVTVLCLLWASLLLEIPLTHHHQLIIPETMEAPDAPAPDTSQI